MSDLTPFVLVAFVILAMAVAPAQAATKKPKSSEKAAGAMSGLGVGTMLPRGAFADFNDPSYLVQSRSLYVEKVFGGRAAAYYGDTAGAHGADGGRVYGFDFDLLLKFGSSHAFGYVFGGAGYGTLTYTSAGANPGDMVRRGGHDWCWTGGVGFTFRKKGGFYLEASYVSFQTNPEATQFIPVVIGYQF